jgi:small conductance mechanosensitive channel
MDMTEAWNTIHLMLRNFVASLPRFVLALVVVVFFYFLGWLVRRGMARAGHVDSAHHTLNIALGRVAHGAIAAIGILFAVAAAFPGFSAGNLIGALGIGGIAIGFAFKDIFENFLSGILILITRPFRIGDQIIWDKYEGTVEDIHIRATWLKTYDGRRVVIPNSDLFTNAVTVNTAFESRRLEYDFKLKNSDSIARAKEIIARVLQETKGVLPDPKADVVITSFDESTVLVKARWWSRSRMGDAMLAQDQVLASVRKALAAEGIELSAPARQVVLADPAPAKDGDRLKLPPVKPDPQ